MVLASLLPLLCACFISISAILVACGWYQILHKNRKAHEKLMKLGALFALVFFIIYMARTIFIGNTTFSETAPVVIRNAYYVFLLFHIVLAFVSAVFGLITLFFAFKERFAKHRKIGRVTAVMWLITAPTGVAVYVLLYLLYPGGATKPVIDAIFGW